MTQLRLVNKIMKLLLECFSQCFALKHILLFLSGETTQQNKTSDDSQWKQINL